MTRSRLDISNRNTILIAVMPNPLFSRLPLPADHRAMGPVVNDLYDKLASTSASIQDAQSQFDALQQQIKSSQTTQNTAQVGGGGSASAGGGSGGSSGGSSVLSIQGATGRAANPQYSFIPVVPTLPNAQPGSNVYTQDGLVIEVGAASTVGLFYRYDSNTAQFVLISGNVKVIVDTHTNRNPNYPAYTQPLGALYVETDRQAIYMDNGQNWVLIAGIGIGLDASKYGDLGTTDTGYLWFSTDSSVVYYWSATAWIAITQRSALCGPHFDRTSFGNGTVSGSTLTATSGPGFQSYWVGNKIGIGGVLFVVATVTDSTHIVVTGTPTSGATTWEMSLYPSVIYGKGTAFCETDRTTVYTVAGASGVVNLSHFAVTWVSGVHFSAYWAGITITINNVVYVVASATRTTLTLTTDSGLVSTGLSYAVPQGGWFYIAGIYHAGTSSKPTDLFISTDIGFEFYDESVLVSYYGVSESAFSADALYLAYKDGLLSVTFATFGGMTFHPSDAGYEIRITDYEHTILYSGSTWRLATGDNSKYAVISIDGNPPQGGVWHLCDGSSVNIFTIVAGVPTVSAFTLPDLRSDVFIRGGTYTGSISPTSAPTFSSAGFTFAGTPATLTGSFTGTPLSIHAHVSPVGFNGGTTGIMTGDFAAITTQSISKTFTVAGSAGSAAFFNTSSESAGTPAGGITINSYTPAGTISGSGTVSAPVLGAGTPKSIAVQWYCRQ